MSLHSALKITDPPRVEGELRLYKVNISKAWCIVGRPQGGYVVCVTLSAASDLQSRSSHPDPIHLTAHFLQPVEVGQCEIQIKVVRRGKRFTNIDADLVQNGKKKITTRMIFGVLPDLTQISSPDPSSFTLIPSSPYGRRIPFSLHPTRATPDKLPDPYVLSQTKAEDRSFEERNEEGARRRQATDSSEQSPPDCGIEWGCWLELKDPADRLDNDDSIFCGLYEERSCSPPARAKTRAKSSWYATVVLTVEFKSRIPARIKNPKTSDSLFSPRTVGIYSSARFLSEGRHDEFVEIWTAPSTIGGSHSDPVSGAGDISGGEIDAGWREKQVCLAISTQMALTIPEENNYSSRL